MKFIETKLTEQVFLDRLTRLCRQKERRDKAYAGQDTFVFDRKQEKFWLGTHHAIGGKNPGLSADRLDCSYRVGEDGFVTVAYRRFKHPALFIPHAVVGVLGLLLAASTLADVIAHRAVSGGEVVTALFFLCFCGAGFFGNSKELTSLEDHLRYICGLADGAEAGETAIPDLSLIRDREVYPLRIIYRGREYLTLSYYPEDGEEDALLHADGELLYFRNRAQLDRFCAEHDLCIVDDVETCSFDEPLSAAEQDYGHILKCWNQLHTIARVLGVPFEGDDPSHDGLYEALFGTAMPMSGDRAEHEPVEERMQELDVIFADKESLLERFRLWRE